MEREFTKQVQSALKMAAKDSMLATAAEECGVSPKQIYAMSSRATMNTDDMLKVATWLLKRGYLPPSVFPWVSPDTYANSLNDLADMVAALVPILRNPDLPADDRILWVRQNLQHVYIYLEALSKKKSR